MSPILVQLLGVWAGVLLGQPQHQPLPPPPTPPTAAVQSEPAIVVLDQVPGCYGAVRFDHKLHTGMASIHGGCANCHHDLKDEDIKQPGVPMRPCKECHDAKSNVITADKPGLKGAYHRQCIGCHKEWAHENACGFCHTNSTAVKRDPNRIRNLTTMIQPRATPESKYVYQTEHKGMPLVTFQHGDHAERFGLKCADCHGGTSCGQCHGAKAERPAVNRQQSCYKCHEETRCVTCHDLRERGNFNHAARSGWRLRPGHAELACDQCHEPGHMPGKPTSDSCRACHAQRWGDSVFDHARTGVELSGNHNFFECLDCHSGGDDRMMAKCCACHTEKPVGGQRWVGPEEKLKERAAGK